MIWQHCQLVTFVPVLLQPFHTLIVFLPAPGYACPHFCMHVTSDTEALKLQYKSVLTQPMPFGTTHKAKIRLGLRCQVALKPAETWLNSAGAAHPTGCTLKAAFPGKTSLLLPEMLCFKWYFFNKHTPTSWKKLLGTTNGKRGHCPTRCPIRNLSLHT